MDIAVLGTGYVGLVTGTCFAELGNHVTCLDINKDKITKLKTGILPIYEPGLELLVNSNVAEKRLQFATQLAELHRTPQVIFIAVGTPSDTDGSADMQYVLSAAKNIGEYITHDCVIVDKSTVPVGVADQVKQIIQQELDSRNVTINFAVVSNPEFLREGAAITDFMQPDRVIIGGAEGKSRELMLDLYLPIMRNPEKIFFMNVKDAEMTKYVANAMLATKISFMNEMSVLCDKLGVDVENVRLGIGSDSRIGSAFIYPGCGYGGSCFPKDVKALMKMAESQDVDPFLLRAVEDRNAQQKLVLSNKIAQVFGDDLSGKTIGVWGLSFKPGTDDMREASSLVLLEKLIERNAKVQAYDPVSMAVAAEMLPKAWFADGRLTLVETQYAAVAQADALVLVTEWKPFCSPDLALMRESMRGHIIFDGRNQYDPKHIRDAEFDYYGIGRN